MAARVCSAPCAPPHLSTGYRKNSEGTEFTLSWEVCNIGGLWWWILHVYLNVLHLLFVARVSLKGSGLFKSLFSLLPDTHVIALAIDLYVVCIAPTALPRKQKYNCFGNYSMKHVWTKFVQLCNYTVTFFFYRQLTCVYKATELLDWCFLLKTSIFLII